MRTDAFGQRDARRDGIDVDTLRAELVRQLAGEGNDATLGCGIGTRAVPAQSPPRNRREIDDLAAAPALHHRDHGMCEQESAVEVEGDELLPVGQSQLFGSGRRLVDHRAAANRVDQDVDPAVVAFHLRDQLVDLPRVQRVDQPALRLAARQAQRRHRLIQAALMVVDGDHRCTLARHDRCGGPADAVCRRSDQCHLALKSHSCSSQTRYLRLAD